MSIPILTAGDTARARRSDPLSSHVAADRSSRTRVAVADAVLWMIGHYGPCDGEALNTHYRERQVGMGWPRAAWDSPRKRAGELVRAGQLITLNADDPRGTPHVYAEARFELQEPPVGEVTS